MIQYTPEENKELAMAFAETLRQSHSSFLIIFYPSDESEPFIEKNGDLPSQIALLDNLQEEICDEAIQALESNERMLIALQKKIDLLGNRN